MSRRATTTDLASAWNECKVRTGDGPHWLYMVFMRSVFGWGACEPRRRWDEPEAIEELEAAKDAEQNEGRAVSSMGAMGDKVIQHMN